MFLSAVFCVSFMVTYSVKPVLMVTKNMKGKS